MMWNFNADDWDKMSQAMQTSGSGEMAWRNYFQFHWVLGLITWILIIVLLISFIRWLWRKGDKTR